MNENTEKKTCTYCGKEVTPNDIVYRVIFGRSRKNGKAVVTKEKLHFCSKECAAYEQMSREG